MAPFALSPGLDRFALTPFKGGGVSYEAEATALFARFTTPPTSARKLLINTLIKSLKDGGIWTKLDALYVMAAADAQAGRRNWKADAYNLSAVSSPTFTADRGYAGNGTSSYLDTGFNPSVGGQYTQNSAHFSWWDRTTRAGAATAEIGVRQGTTVWADGGSRTATDFMNSRMHTNSVGLATANTVSSGHFVANRSASNAIQNYRNGTLLGSGSAIALTPPNGNVFLLAQNNAGVGANGYSSDQLASASIGAGLTAQNVSDLYSALNTYLQAVGAA